MANVRPGLQVLPASPFPPRRPEAPHAPRARASFAALAPTHPPILPEEASVSFFAKKKFSNPSRGGVTAAASVSLLQRGAATGAALCSRELKKSPGFIRAYPMIASEAVEASLEIETKGLDPTLREILRFSVLGQGWENSQLLLDDPTVTAATAPPPWPPRAGCRGAAARARPRAVAGGNADSAEPGSMCGGGGVKLTRRCCPP